MKFLNGILCLVVFATTWHISVVLAGDATSIRLAGLFLQFLGMLLATKEIVHYWKRTIKWWDSFAILQRKKRDIVMGAGAGSIEAVFGEAKGKFTPPREIEEKSEIERIAALETSLEQVKTIQNNIAKSLEVSKVELKKKYDDEIENLEKMLYVQMRSLRSPRLSALVGVVWIMMGMFLSTMASEISTFHW